MWVSAPDEYWELVGRPAQCLDCHGKRCVKEFLSGTLPKVVKFVMDESLTAVAVRHMHEIHQLKALRDASLGT